LQPSGITGPLGAYGRDAFFVGFLRARGVDVGGFADHLHLARELESATGKSPSAVGRGVWR
jgi:hypothetical protein